MTAQIAENVERQRSNVQRRINRLAGKTVSKDSGDFHLSSKLNAQYFIR
jgi:phage regulator Rha-like protein